MLVWGYWRTLGVGFWKANTGALEMCIAANIYTTLHHGAAIRQARLCRCEEVSKPRRISAWGQQCG